jgi:hypothetical protein
MSTQLITDSQADKQSANQSSFCYHFGADYFAKRAEAPIIKKRAEAPIPQATEE